MTKLNETLADVVAEDASRARTLDRLGLDYCCGRDETLDHACARVGLDASEVVAQLQKASAVGEKNSCAGMSAGELVRHLVDVHHTYLHAELPELDRVAQRCSTNTAHATPSCMRSAHSSLRYKSISSPTYSRKSASCSPRSSSSPMDPRSSLSVRSRTRSR